MISTRPPVNKIVYDVCGLPDVLNDIVLDYWQNETIVDYIEYLKSTTSKNRLITWRLINGDSKCYKPENIIFVMDHFKEYPIEGKKHVFLKRVCTSNRACTL